MSNFGPGQIHANMTPLEVALTQLDVRETTENRGPQVDEYLRMAGLDPEKGSYPWCVAFVRWCCSRVGIWLPRTAGVKRLWEMGQHLAVETPQIGDVAIHLRKDGLGHVGFYMRHMVQEGGVVMVETCEGNTNAEGAREGTMVAIKERPLDYWNIGWIRPPKPSAGLVS